MTDTILMQDINSNENNSLEQKISELSDKLIHDQFNKILEIKIGDKNFKIAPLSDQIPSIFEVDISNDKLVILFSSSDKLKIPQRDLEILTGNNGKINGIVISGISKININDYRKSLNRILFECSKNLPDSNNTREIVENHLSKRIIHALSELINKLPKYIPTNIARLDM